MSFNNVIIVSCSPHTMEMVQINSFRICDRCSVDFNMHLVVLCGSPREHKLQASLLRGPAMLLTFFRSAV